MDINRLRELANAASVGPWESAGKSVRRRGTQQHYSFGATAPNGIQGGICNCLGARGVGATDAQAKANAAYIAALDPQTVTALLNVADAAVRWRTQARTSDTFWLVLEELGKAVDDMEKQG